MTKRVRIENADTADYTVLVEVWDKGSDGAPDVLVRTIELRNPCMLAGGDDSLYLTSTRYIVVREK